METITLRAGAAEAEIYLHGAHVTKWRTASGVDVLYLSPQAVFAPDKAIRGGVPICWPQFSDMGPCKAAHGSARVSKWEAVSVRQGTPEQPEAEAAFRLSSKGSPDPNAGGLIYTLHYIVTLRAEDLRLQLSVTNDGPDPMSFTTALHSYFRVPSIDSLRITGVLDSLPYADNLQARAVQPPQPISTVTQEVDRIYYGSRGNPVNLHLNGSGPAAVAKLTTISITAENFADSVFWNPWIEKSKKMADVPDDGYTQFVCVESGCVQEKVVVAAGQRWSAAQSIRVNTGVTSDL